MSSFEPTVDANAVIVCVVALVVWGIMAWLHTALRKQGLRIALVLPRMGAAFTFWLMALRTVAGLIETSPHWSFLTIGLVAAVVSEVVFWCYPSVGIPGEPTRRFRPNLVHLFPFLLRFGVIGLLAILLLQPTLSHEKEKRQERTIAVIMDTSASMNLAARTAPNDDRKRREIANELLADRDQGGKGILDALKKRYKVDVYQMGATAQRRTEREVAAVARQSLPDSAASSDASQSTDIAAALRRINGDIPSSELSGVVLLTDGCDHSDSDVRAAAGFLEGNSVPLNSVLVGSSEPIRDAEVVALQAPSQMFVGDELNLQAVIRADQFQHESATVRLLEGDEVIEERDLKITSDRHRETINFRHKPEQARIHNYRVELAGIEDDETPENNTATSQVWVTNDRIRVLIVEERPRWEFRYLRNLFAGRDRSIFLQAVLLQPDRLAGVPEPITVRASALRAFDDCNANALPATEAEWLKFDVIILGDVAPARLGANGVRVLETFVRDLGGSLVVVSGSNHMPHAYGNTPLRDLLPAKITRQAANVEAGNRFRPTAAGLKHVVLQRAGINTETAWESFPDLSWRHPASEAKIGATVLAYAARKNIAADAEQQRQRALMLWHRFGAGKVLQMNFDESWRLRYGIGDRVHHQFWGQIVRWCASDRLSVGTDLVRMGTDKVMYRVGEAIKVKARLLDAQRNPVLDGRVRASLMQDDEVIHSVELTPDAAKSGLLTAEIRDVKNDGAYRIELVGDDVDRLLALDSSDAESVGMEIGIRNVATGNEALDIVADDTVLRQLADWTGGTVATPADAERVLESLGPESSFSRRRWATPLWNTWPVVLAFLSILSLEWVLRKKAGLV